MKTFRINSLHAPLVKTRKYLYALVLSASFASLPSCSQTNWTEDPEVELLARHVNETFGVDFKLTDNMVHIRAARQNRSPKEFAIVKLVFSNTEFASRFEEYFINLYGYKQPTDQDIYILNVDSIPWWDFENVQAGREYRMQSINSNRDQVWMTIIFSNTKTENVYIEVSGEEWEK